jgi:hypothetical protein
MAEQTQEQLDLSNLDEIVLSQNQISRISCGLIVHANNGRHQTWSVSKNVCLQIIGELKYGNSTFKVTRQGEDR